MRRLKLGHAECVGTVDAGVLSKIINTCSVGVVQHKWCGCRGQLFGEVK